MAHAVTVDRRLAPRLTGAQAGVERIRFRGGRSARVVDLSASGALIEADWRLLPGSRVDLLVGDPTPHRATGRIVRSHVSFLSRERIRYHGAVAFDDRIPL
jgi:hypothetical protein